MEYQFNFAAGPTSLPKEVLSRLAEELAQGNGETVLELSPRHPRFTAIYEETEALLREYLSIPENYRVFFMHGTPANQHAAVAMNLLGESKKADYVISGQTAMRASIEAKRYGDIAVAASSAGASFTFIPATSRESFRQDASYVHICYSNAYHGTQFPYTPDTGDIPLVADMTACLGMEEINISEYGLIYAGTQDNLGISGMTVVIVREDLLKGALPETPSVLDYGAIHNSMVSRNVPSLFHVYATKLMLEYLIGQGGLTKMAQLAKQRAGLLYDYLDHQNYYIVPIDKASRSMCSVVFRTEDGETDRQFLAEAERAGFKNLTGNRAMSGMRACLFNAMPLSGVEKLVTFMKQFATNHPLGE